MPWEKSKSKLGKTPFYVKDTDDPGDHHSYACSKSGSADAGLGILSAARLYDLDFLPLCVEEYDLLIPDAARDTPPVRALLDTLASAAFRDKLLEMGGYTLDAPGEEIEWRS